MQLREVGPDRLVGRSGGGCLAVFGLPFFVAGLALTIAAALGKVTDSDTGEPAPLYFAIPFGLVFVAVGAGLIFGRSGVSLDRTNRQISKWWGLMVPFRSTDRSLDEFHEVRITKEVRSSGKSTYTVYPIRLAGSAEPIVVGEPRDYQEARQTGEQVAKFIGCPMADTTSGRKVRREVAELDESLRQRLVRTGEGVAWPEPPPDMRCTYQIQGDSVRIEIPPSGFTIAHKLVMAAGCLPTVIAVIFALATGLWSDDSMPAAFRIFLVGFLGVFFCLLPIAATSLPSIHDAIKRVTVDVSPGELCATSRGLTTRRQQIPTHELEELEVVRSRRKSAGVGGFFCGRSHLVARSDRVSIEIAPKVEIGELEWVRGAILYVVTGAA